MRSTPCWAVPSASTAPRARRSPGTFYKRGRGGTRRDLVHRTVAGAIAEPGEPAERIRPSAHGLVDEQPPDSVRVAQPPHGSGGGRRERRVVGGQPRPVPERDEGQRL